MWQQLSFNKLQPRKIKDGIPLLFMMIFPGRNEVFSTEELLSQIFISKFR